MHLEHGLAERLVVLDAEVVALRGELARRSALQAQAPLMLHRWQQRDQHPWPVIEASAGDGEVLDPYDRRPDDPVIHAARDGAAFLARLGDFVDPEVLALAADDLASLSPPMMMDGMHVVSVIVPVHGQLAWTLNCLDSVFRHKTRYPFEVIVVDDGSFDETASVIGRLAGSVKGLSMVRLATNAGFVAACNTGAAVARGKFLVLLNNDTRVVPGWLDELIESFGLFPDAGLVGSKLLYPDGRLQEAGAILWRDGSAWNYGRGDDPNRPEFCHARQADYVSGASMCLPTALWQKLGGLDPLFSPGYAEDADLAMRIRAAGHEVWFQPASRVVHYEGRTGGTDTSGGAKAHQLSNLKKLFVRWRAQLARHGRAHSNDPYLEADRTATRRALVVEATTPTPKQDAGSGVVIESMKLLQNLGYKIHFVPQDNFLFHPVYTAALQRIGVVCGYAPFDVDFEKYVSQYGFLFDVIMVFRPTVLVSIEDSLRRHAPKTALVFSNADLHFLRLERQAALSGDRQAQFAAAAARAEELALISRCSVTMTLSTFERDLLAREVPDAAVVLQPFPYPLVGTATTFASRRDFLFLGGYNHPPNVDAALHFVRDIMPLIRQRLPEAKVIISGANPSREILSINCENVEVTGFVEELAPLFDRVRVFVCPLRVGAGVKGKLITAMAHGLPVVATHYGAEGIDIVPGREMLVESDLPAFAAASIQLHEDAALWSTISAAGMAYVKRACSVKVGERALATAIDMAYRR